MRRAHLRGIYTVSRAGLLLLAGLVLVWVDRRWDRPRGRIPNAVSLPLLGIGLVGALAFRDLSGLLLWPAIYLGWRAGGVGAGDAKVWMGLVALGGIEGAVIGLAVLVGLAWGRAWRMGSGWRRVRVPMAGPAAGMALGAAAVQLVAALAR